MKGFAASLLLLAAVLALYTESAVAQDVATLTAQFDNRAFRLTGGKKAEIIAAVAQVFGVPANQVQFLNAIDQSGLTAQSVATFRITGPSSQRKPVRDICHSMIRAFPGFDSKLENGIEKATDSWLPGDKIEFEKGTCA